MGATTDRVAVVVDESYREEFDEDEGVVINWFVAEGKAVAAGDTLCEIQIEKVDIDVPAPVDGTVDEIVRGEDDPFEIGDTLAYLRPD